MGLLKARLHGGDSRSNVQPRFSGQETQFIIIMADISTSAADKKEKEYFTNTPQEAPGFFSDFEIYVADDRREAARISYHKV